MQLTNETLINGEVGSYFRQIDGRWELNRQIDPHHSREEWATIPGEAVRICQAVTSNSITLGQLLRYMCEAYTKLVAAEAQVDMLSSHGAKMAEIIAARFWAEARDRNWCSEADDIVSEINIQMRNAGIPWSLEPREREYRILASETYEVTIERTILVTASDQDAAIALANEEDDLDDDEICDQIRSYVNPHLQNREIIDIHLA